MASSDRFSQKQATIHYASGAAYTGTVNAKNERHGFGILYTATQTYEGLWKNGKKCGMGKLTWTCSGDLYVGEFQDNIMHGEGTMHWHQNEESYTGQWESGRMNGRGIMKYKNGDTLEGTFREAMAHGYCRKTFASGDSHEGFYEQDCRHGYGTYVWADGDSYHGEWCQGKMHGRGVKRYARGGEYSGDWQNNMAHGCGERLFRNGDRHYGSYKNDMRNGTGTYIFMNGDSYNGDWVNGRMCGRGVKFMRNNGDQYDGAWRDDAAHGFGIKTFASGDRYIGMYSNDLREGKGVYLYTDGSEYEGGWKKNVQSGFGKYKYSNGDEFLGRWKYGRKVGPGYNKTAGEDVTYIEIWNNGYRLHRVELTKEQCKDLPSVETLWVGTRAREAVQESRKHGKSDKLDQDVTITDIVDKWRWAWEKDSSAFWGQRYRRRGLERLQQGLYVAGTDAMTCVILETGGGLQSAVRSKVDNTFEPQVGTLAVAAIALVEEMSDESGDDGKLPALSSPKDERFSLSDPDAAANDILRAEPAIKRQYPSFASSSTESTSGAIRLTGRRRKKRIRFT